MKRLILSLLLLAPALSYAQRHHEIGLMGGVSNYYGDLQDEKLFPDYNYHPVGGILYKYFVSPRLGVRFGAAYTRLGAADSLSQVSIKRARNLDFSTDLVEFHAGAEFNFLPVDVDRMKVSPYIFGGVALFYSNPYTQDLNGDKVFLRAMSTEGQGLPQYPDRKEYNLVNVAFPFGGGLKFFVGKTLMITTELGFRYCATDYLDDVSKSYVNLDTLAAMRGKLAADLSYRGDEISTWDGKYPDYRYQRGDSKNYDWYWFGGINIAVYFDAFGNLRDYWQTHCPYVFRNRRDR